MDIQVDVPPDPDRVSRLLRQVHARSFRRYRLAGIVIVLAGLGYLVAAWRSRMSPFGAFLVLGVGVMYFLLPSLMVRKSRSGSSKLAGGAWTYVLSDHRLAASSPSSREELEWQVFERARETEDHFLLHMSKMQVVGIPHDRMTPADRNELRAFLQARGLLPAAAARGAAG